MDCFSLFFFLFFFVENCKGGNRGEKVLLHINMDKIFEIRLNTKKKKSSYLLDYTCNKKFLFNFFFASILNAI